MCLPCGANSAKHLILVGVALDDHRRENQPIAHDLINIHTIAVTLLPQERVRPFVAM